MLNTCRVVHVAQYLMLELGLQFPAGFVEPLELEGGEIVEVVAVASHEMREHGARYHGLLIVQLMGESCHFIIVGGIEAQAMHARVELDMDGPACDALFACGFDERIEQTETIHFRLQAVVEHGLEGRHLGIHNHDVGGDARLAKRHTLVGHSHSQVVHAMVLQRLGYFHSSSPIAVGLDHAHHFRIGAQERAVVVQIVHHGIKVHFKDGFMHFPFQQLRNAVETETTIKFTHCYYGIAILVAAILVIIFVLMEKRIGYTIATVSGVILAIWGIFDMMNYKIIENGQIDIKGAFYSPLNGLKYNSILEVRNGAGYYLLIGSIIFLLVMMLINFAKGDEDDE